jgi:hypothetical protein
MGTGGSFSCIFQALHSNRKLAYCLKLVGNSVDVTGKHVEFCTIPIEGAYALPAAKKYKVASGTQGKDLSYRVTRRR